jgi:2,4-dienoyl-CoA reductase-like NADH-dependent reductase (Old Yellow Enzyme family)/thioredoxin reductase
MKFKMLFSPMSIGSLEIKNRIVMAPMLMGFGAFDGTPTPQLMDYYEERAKGGVGLIITEITRVDDKNGAAAFSQLGMSKDYQIAPMKEMVDRIHRHGTKIFVQLHHPGRQNLGLLVGTVPLSIFMDKYLPFYHNVLYKIVPAGKLLLKYHLVPRVLSPSKCERSYFSDGVNRSLRKSEIIKLIGQFADAALRVKQSGADGVELHASHGYLIQQFLSPNTNKRDDEFGGSLENRMRFLTEIIRRIRKKCGSDFPIIVRLTVDECYDRIGKPGKGYNLEEGIEIARMLEKSGIDAIDVSSAAYDTFNYWLEPPSFECGWRAYMAERVKKAVSIPVIAANLIRSPEQAEQQLQDYVQDFISLGRPMLADPYWSKKIAEGNDNSVKRCICCLYCIESMQNNAFKGSHGQCSVNPMLGRENLELKMNGKGKTVVIVGAGPGGLTAAEILAKRGFETIIIEQSGRTGGQVMLAENIPLKEKLLWCIEDLTNSAVSAGAKIILNTKADKELISGFSPYAVIIATGGNAIKPKTIQGIGLPNVCTVTEILNGTVTLHGRKVAVIGSGMTGLETAEVLSEQGNKVFVVEMAKSIAPGTWMQHRDDILPRLEEKKVEFLTSKKLTAVHRNFITIESIGVKKSQSTLECEQVVLSLGVRSENALYNELKPFFKNLYVIGDANKPGRIAQATESAYATVMGID